MVLALCKEPILGAFNDLGLYDSAAIRPAATGRRGGLITPRAVVVHTTDMLPNGFDGLVRAWSAKDSTGACAHFILGRDPTQGLVQMVPIVRNGYHADGTGHGNWVLPNGSKLDPNQTAVGIEVHNAGRLDWLTADKAVYSENHKALAEFRVGLGEVFVDDLGRPWHAATRYQFDMLAQLLSDIKPHLTALMGAVPVPGTALVKDRSKWDMSYAVPVARSLVGHASLHPAAKMDPGPQLMAFINDFAKNEGWS